MTQLTLFDSSATAVANHPQTTPSSPKRYSGTSDTKTSPRSRQSEHRSRRDNTPASAPTVEPVKASQPANPIGNPVGNDTGVQRMGDLARLVLMRYELVAKRRAMFEARLAAKRQAKAK